MTPASKENAPGPPSGVWKWIAGGLATLLLAFVTAAFGAGYGMVRDQASVTQKHEQRLTQVETELRVTLTHTAATLVEIKQELQRLSSRVGRDGGSG